MSEKAKQIKTYEKTKKHLIDMFQGMTIEKINELIDLNYKYFDYIQQPKQKAIAIASTI